MSSGGPSSPEGKKASNVEEFRKRYETLSTKKAADDQAARTLTWMRQNKESYNSDGSLRRVPWWPVPPVTSCPILRATREDVLRDRAYGHGILHFLYGLIEAGIVPEIDGEVIELVLDPMTRVVLREMVALRYSSPKADSVSLAKLRLLYGYSANHQPAKIRPLLWTLCGIGILNAHSNQGYAISLGMLGDIFYAKVYMPILGEAEINYRR